ncbi:MAG: hypothetical protein ACI9BW_003482, partial [Gammaproteobacteria bacterium]
PRVKLALLVLFLAHPTTEPHAASILEEYVGQPSEQLIQTLGEPQLRTPDQLWYTRESGLRGGQLGAPQVTISGASSRFIVGGEYQQFSIANLPCDVIANVDEGGLVTSIEQKGPGCTEFVYLLQQRQAGTRPKPR